MKKQKKMKKKMNMNMNKKMNSPDHANVTRSITNQTPLTKSTEMNIFIKEQNLYKCYLTIKHREFCKCFHFWPGAK